MTDRESKYRTACARLIGYANGIDAVLKYGAGVASTDYLKRLLQYAQEAEALAPWNEPDAQDHGEDVA